MPSVRFAPFDVRRRLTGEHHTADERRPPLQWVLACPFPPFAGESPANNVARVGPCRQIPGIQAAGTPETVVSGGLLPVDEALARGVLRIVGRTTFGRVVFAHAVDGVLRPIEGHPIAC